MRKLAPFLFCVTLMAAIPDLAELNRMIARFAPVELHADTSKLSAGDQKALAKLLEAARIIDDIFLDQVWSGNRYLRQQLVRDTSELGKAQLHYFDLNKGPWSELDDHAAFLPYVPEKKLPGANFYPESLTRAQLETSFAEMPKAEREQATGFFTVIRRANELYRDNRDSKGTYRSRNILAPIDYSSLYRNELNQVAILLRQAAELTPNP
jgi:hypothetical protein